MKEKICKEALEEQREYILKEITKLVDKRIPPDPFDDPYIQALIEITQVIHSLK